MLGSFNLGVLFLGLLFTSLIKYHIKVWYHCCVCVCYWPPVHEVCPNYEVVVFQPWKLTTLDLGSVAYCYIAYLLNPPHLLFLTSYVRQGEASHSFPDASSNNVSLHGIICPTGRHPSTSQHT